MVINSLDLTRQYKELKPEIDKAILDVCESGMFCLGETVKKFEEEVANYIGVKHAVGVNSGSAALILALEALRIGRGDEVIVPTNTYIATVFAVSHVGATPVFVDHDKYYNINVNAVKEKINDKTKAMIAVHLYGQPCKMDELLDVASTNRLFLIEDCAQAFGASYKKKKVGSFGHVACFSFYPGKNLGAYGDGGIVITNIASVEERLRMLRNDGQSEKYKHAIVGYNERLDAIQAAVLGVKLKHINDWNRKRGNIATTYRDLILEKKLNVGLPNVMENAEHVYHQFVINVQDRDTVRKKLWDNYKIGTGIHYPIPCHMQECYIQYNQSNCPNAENNADTLLSLPMFPEMTSDESVTVINKLAECLK